MNGSLFFAFTLNLAVPFAAHAMPLHHTRPNNVSFVFSIDASIDGMPRAFVLDTGSPQTSLVSDPQAAAMVRVGRGGYMGAQQKPVVCDKVQMAQAALADLKIENARALRCPVSLSTDNVLGLDWLEGKVFKLTFSRHDFGVSESQQAQNFSFKRTAERHIILPLEIAGTSASAIFDTGCATTAVDMRLVRAQPAAFMPIQADSQIVYDSAKIEMSVRYYRVSEIKIGPLTLKDQVVMAFDFSEAMTKLISDGEHPAAIIGSNSMVAADWIFDLKTNTWSAKLR